MGDQLALVLESFLSNYYRKKLYKFTKVLYFNNTIILYFQRGYGGGNQGANNYYGRGGVAPYVPYRQLKDENTKIKNKLSAVQNNNNALQNENRDLKKKVEELNKVIRKIILVPTTMFLSKY